MPYLVRCMHDCGLRDSACIFRRYMSSSIVMTLKSAGSICSTIQGGYCSARKPLKTLLCL